MLHYFKQSAKVTPTEEKDNSVLKKEFIHHNYIEMGQFSNTGRGGDGEIDLFCHSPCGKGTFNHCGNEVLVVLIYIYIATPL